MGQVVDSTNEISYPGWRRHSDPPNLWLHVLTGSILLHALALLSMRQFIVPLSPPPSSTPVPIDLIAVNPTTVAASRSIRNLKTVNKQGTTGKLPQSQNIIPARNQTVRNPVFPSSSITPFTRSPQQSILPSSASKPLTSGLRRSRPTPPFSQPFTTPSPKSGRTAPGPSSGPTPPQSPRLTPASTPASPSESQGGQGFVVKISDPQLGNGGTDIPDRPARPIIPSQPFPDLTYTAQTRKQFGKAVKLRLQILADGTLQTIETKKTSGNAEYDLLAKEQLINWRFEPAYQKNRPVASLLDIYVTLNPMK